MRRLHVFDAMVRGRIAHITLSTSIGIRVGHTLLRGLTPELWSVAEIEAWGQLLMADLAAAINEAKRDFRKSERGPRPLLFRSHE